mmetsp:Transcript_42522/g.104726  ORF Transcript_42522/g.104726 Transcript_42522/m.104726 type:complete len:627 (+) Transcript_42522:74-1954(+)
MAPSTHISGLPMMPGNSVRDFSKTDFRKRSSLGMRAGVMQVEDASEVAVREESLAKTLSRKLGITDVPEHMTFDGKVLRYECYFKEAVVESNDENYRVRRCVMLLYLLDGSMQVSEPKLENSGIPQGEGKGAVFIKRHRIAKPDGSFVSMADLAVGGNVTLYGRTFHLTDADAFTREFVERVEGRVEGPAEETPLDPYNTMRATKKEQTVRNQKYFHPRPSEDDLMRYMEAKLGASTAQLGGDKLGKFLRHDRQVLRFFLAWDDRGRMYGELRPFTLHYYLQDDEVEILEVRRANSGRDPFPAFVKKGKLAKDLETLIRTNAPTTHTTQLIDRSGKVDPDTMRFYSETDLSVGKEINVNGITFLIYGCDKYTRDYYRSVYGVEMGEIPLSFDSTVVRPQVQIPAHYAGHPGTEEDSLGSFLYLTPKVPKKNFMRMLEYDQKVFRFMARLQTDRVEDSDRVFVVKYFLADDTVGVFEPPARNSGIVGGKFLERGRVKKPDGTWYLQSDFYVGSRVHFHTHEFVLYQADEYTLALMESECALHPMSDLDYIYQQLAGSLKDGQKAKLAQRLEAADNGSGYVGYADFQAALGHVGLDLQDQALITLMRKHHAADSQTAAVASRDFLASF